MFLHVESGALAGNRGKHKGRKDLAAVPLRQFYSSFIKTHIISLMLCSFHQSTTPWMVHTSDSEEISKEKAQQCVLESGSERFESLCMGSLPIKRRRYPKQWLLSSISRTNETMRLRAKFTTDDSGLSWTLGTSITNSFSFLHLIMIPISLIIPPSLMGVIFISTWKEIFVSESLLRGWMGTSRLITYNLELTGTIHFEMICMRRRIIGLLQSQDLDGKPTFGFIVTGSSVNELLCPKAPRGDTVPCVGCCRREFFEN